MDLLLGQGIGFTSIKENIFDLKGKLGSGENRVAVLSHPDNEVWKILI